MHIQQLHVKNQRCVWRDARTTPRSIRQIWWDAQLALAADLHARHPFVPTFDHLTGPEHKFERLPRAHRAVELLSIGEPARVVDLNLLSALRDGTSPDLDVPIFKTAGRLDGLASDLGGAMRNRWRLFCWSCLGHANPH